MGKLKWRKYVFGPDKNWNKCSIVGCHGVRTLNFPRDKDWLLWAHLLWNVSSWMIAITIAYSEVLRQKAEIELNFCFGDNWKCFLDKKIVAIELSTNFSCFHKVLLSNHFGQNITIKLNLRLSVNSFTRLNLFPSFRCS